MPQVNRQSRPAKISIFNHKGGVGKTTLTMNIAATLASMGRRVLLIDSDPQCNLTSYLISDDVVDDLLDKADSAEGQTIWSSVRPLSEATGGIRQIKPLPTSTDNLFILPGDIRLSEFESDLVEFWGQSLQRKPKGFRGTTALSEMVTKAGKDLKVDYIFYDSGPNIGPLNRVILLDSDFFIVPVSCDLFSLRALKTLGRTLSTWITEWSTICDLAPKDTILLKGKPQFLGYIPGNFRVYGGDVSSEQMHYLTRIEKEVFSQVIAILRRIDPSLAVGTTHQTKLGSLKDFGALVPASQREGKAIYHVNAGSIDQRREAKSALRLIAENVEARIKELG